MLFLNPEGVNNWAVRVQGRGRAHITQSLLGVPRDLPPPFVIL